MAQGLILDLGGAPSTPHVIPGVPGLWHPDRPTPVGGPGELPPEEARRLDADPGTHLRLVDIPDGDLARLRDAAQEDAVAVMRTIDDITPAMTPPELAGLRDQQQAAMAATPPPPAPTPVANPEGEEE